MKAELISAQGEIYIFYEGRKKYTRSSDQKHRSLGGLGSNKSECGVNISMRGNIYFLWGKKQKYS